VVAASAGIVVAPWIVWTTARFGTIVQDSARAIALRSSTLAAVNGDSVLGSGLRRLGGWSVDLVTDLGIGFGPGLAATLIGLGAAAAIALRRRRSIARDGSAAATPTATGATGATSAAGATGSAPGPVRTSRLLALAAAVVLPAVFYAFVLRFRQAWYLLPSLWILCLVGGAALERVARAALLAGTRARSAARAAGAALALAALALFAREGRRAVERGFYPWQDVVRALTLEANQRVPRAVRFGAINSGIVSWMSPGREVINLDGVVNGAAIEALREHQLRRFLGEQHVEIVIDLERYVRMYSVFAEPTYPSAFVVLRSAADPVTGQRVVVLGVRPP
jgi:hypothetical protein